MGHGSRERIEPPEIVCLRAISIGPFENTDESEDQRPRVHARPNGKGEFDQRPECGHLGPRRSGSGDLHHFHNQPERLACRVVGRTVVRLRLGDCRLDRRAEHADGSRPVSTKAAQGPTDLFRVPGWLARRECGPSSDDLARSSCIDGCLVDRIVLQTSLRSQCIKVPVGEVLPEHCRG